MAARSLKDIRMSHCVEHDRYKYETALGLNVDIDINHLLNI